MSDSRQHQTLVVTEDHLLGGRLRLLQPEDGYRAAIDPVVLAAAIPAQSGQKIVELGCGVGAAALSLLARLEAEKVTPATLVGVELDPQLVEIARRNATLNGFERVFRILKADLRLLPPVIEPVSFDHVMINPPFLDPSSNRVPTHLLSSRSNFEGTASLSQWIEKAMKLLRPQGQLTIIHRADRLGDLLLALDGKAGGLVLYPLWPKQHKPAKRILVRARKDSRAKITLSPGLVLHESDGRFTAEAEAILREAKPIDLE